MTIINKIYGIDVDGRRAVNGSKRGEGFDVEKVHRKDLNQLLFELGADHIIGSQSQVTGLTATIYYDSATTSFKDKNGAAPTILNGDKIAWRGLDTITANIDLSTYDDIEHIMFQSITIALGAFDLDLGENQRGELNLSGTGTLTVLSSDGLRVKTAGGLVVDNQSGDVIVNNANNIGTDFVPKNLLINLFSTTEATVTAESIELVNSTYNKNIITDVDLLYNTANDRQTGTSLLNSHWYDLFTDENKSKLMVPNLEGSANGTNPGFLVATTNLFFTYEVSQGDIVFNMATFEATTVKTTPTADNDDLEVNDDIFTSGDTYKIIILSPSEIGKYPAIIGKVKVGSGGLLDDSGYTRPELQPSIEYKGNHTGNLDFTLTGQAGLNVVDSSIFLTQSFSFASTPEWFIALTAIYAQTANTTADIAITGATFDQNYPGSVDTGSQDTRRVLTANTTSNIAVRLNNAREDLYLTVPVARLQKKPSWATRS